MEQWTSGWPAAQSTGGDADERPVLRWLMQEGLIRVHNKQHNQVLAGKDSTVRDRTF